MAGKTPTGTQNWLIVASDDGDMMRGALSMKSMCLLM
jgi:hypothetical protein